MAWLTGYLYRKAIVIAHTTDGAQTNYQLKLLVGESSGATGEDVDCGAKVASDFDDLRFTTSDGSTLCNYWIESITGSTPNQLATVWIKVPSIAAHPDDTTIYMYYGNSGASAPDTPLAMGKATFLFFDDFNNGTTLDPQWGTTGGSPTVGSGVLTLNSSGEYVKSTYTGLYKALRFSAKFGLRSETYQYMGWNNNAAIPAINPAAIIYTLYSSGTDCDFAYTGDTDSAQSDPNVWSKNAYKTFDIIWTSAFCKYYEAGSLKVTASTAANIYGSALPVFLGTLNGAGNPLLVDWVAVRNYTATEPTWSSFGAEEMYYLNPQSIYPHILVQ